MRGVRGSRSAAMRTDADEAPVWHGELRVLTSDPRTETPGVPASAGGGTAPSGRAETYVSYGVRSETTLPHFRRARTEVRRRFQDFSFLHDALVKEFPACIVPPLPEKRRIGYLIGDRFSDEFVQRRVGELQLFLERVCRHPTLQRAAILEQFLASREWVCVRLTQHIDMHTHRGRPVTEEGAAPASAPGMLEQMSDTVLNAFARVRKPDPRFMAITAELERDEESLAQLRRVLLRQRMHVSGTYAAPWCACGPRWRAPYERKR